MEVKIEPKQVCFRGTILRQLLGFLVNNRGIEESTKQIRAITEMGPPHCVEDV
jgi:hypothetical protein